MAGVANTGMPGSPIDKSVTPKNAVSPFRPNGSNVLIAASGAASQVYVLPRNPTRADDCVRLYNPGTVSVRFRFGSDLTEVATLADKAVPPGAIEIFRVNPSTLTIAVISASAGSLEVDLGFGV